MPWNRREVLGALGLASARALTWAFAGCAPARSPGAARPVAEISGELQPLLRGAIAALHGAGASHAHALAVRRTRRTIAADVLGASIARETAEGVVLTIDGGRETATTGLTERGIADAVGRLVPKAARPAAIDFGPAPAPLAEHPELAAITDAELVDRVAALGKGEGRIVYAAGLYDIDDVTVWSVARGRERAERAVHVRHSATYIAWDRDRPNAIEVARAWTGRLDDRALDAAELARARALILQPITQGAFPAGAHPFVLAPAVGAALIDAAVRALFAPEAAKRPDVAARLAGVLGGPALTIIDDPRTDGAYGGFGFDDAGTPAAARTLVDRGRAAGVLGGRRWGHIGPAAAMPSHLRVVPGTASATGTCSPCSSLAPITLGDGFRLEGVRHAAVDPASGHAVVAVARALELAAGQPSGRMYADVELAGDLGELLGSIGEASLDTQAFGIRDERDGLPLWRSIEAPFLRGSGALRGGA